MDDMTSIDPPSMHEKFETESAEVILKYAEFLHKHRIEQQQRIATRATSSLGFGGLMGTLGLFVISNINSLTIELTHLWLLIASILLFIFSMLISIFILFPRNRPGLPSIESIKDDIDNRIPMSTSDL